MESVYITLKISDIDFTPLQEKIYTIRNCKLFDVRISEYVQFFAAKVNDYIVKIKFLEGTALSGTCDCKDFTMRKRQIRSFCKHILYLYDYIKQESSIEGENDG
jgi:hypothetical protein